MNDGTQPPEDKPSTPPIAKAVTAMHPKGGAEQVTQQLIASSLREYGTLSLQKDNLTEELGRVTKRMEEVRQHIAALETVMNKTEELKKPAPKVPA